MRAFCSADSPPPAAAGGGVGWGGGGTGGDGALACNGVGERIWYGIEWAECRTQMYGNGAHQNVLYMEK